MVEWLSPAVAYSVIKDAWGWLRGKRRRLSAKQKLELREKWKPLFAEEIYKNRSRGLREDVIIRDVRRMDRYPDLDAESKGISPWFRVGLVGRYHRGIEVALGIHALVWEATEEHWRVADYDSEKDQSINGYQIGYIPYDAIESVDWNGDEYYSYPHIYCYFEHSGQPYERIAFCEKRDLNGHVFFTELDSVADVRLTSQKFGTARYLWTS